MTYRSWFIIILSVLFSVQCFSQRRFTGDSYNRLGFQAGLNSTVIKSDQFNFSSGTGFMAGLTTRANTYEDFLVIYGVNFYQFNSTMQVLEDNTNNAVEIDFKGTGVQLNFFIGHKIFGEHLSVEAGPVLQFNGKWAPEAGKENYRLKNYDLIASDIEDVSKFNVNLAANVSAGIARLKVWAQYQYGLTNMYRGLDTTALKSKDSRITNPRGNMMMATAGIVFYL